MRIGLMTTVIALAASSAAMAQDSVPPGPPQQIVPPLTNSAARQSLDEALAERNYAQRVRFFQTRQVERWERAERLSEMANAGQCNEAVIIAKEERDTAMADRLADACSPRRR